MAPGSPVATEISCEEVYFDAEQTLHKRRGSCRSSVAALLVAPASADDQHHNNLTLSEKSSTRSQKIQSSQPRTSKPADNVVGATSPPATEDSTFVERVWRPLRPYSNSTTTIHTHPEDATDKTHRSSDSGDSSGVAQNGLCDTRLLDQDLPTIPGAFESAHPTPYRSRPQSSESVRGSEDHSFESKLAHHALHTSVEHHWLNRGFLPTKDTVYDHSHLNMEDDLFIEAAEEVRPRPRRAENASNHAKRLSLPQSELRAFTAMDNRRPRTSGGPSSARPGSRLDEIRSTFRHRTELAEHHRSPSATTYAGLPEGVTVRPRRNSKYSTAPDQPSSPLSPSRRAVRSPDMSIFGRSATAIGTRRGSQLAALRRGSDAESPAESIEQKQVESVSAESQTAPSTVWDELDDLKSRIKKLELTGKLPSTSGAAIAGGGSQSERPRTATTAPTTIDLSPKRDKTQQVEEVQTLERMPATPTSTEMHPLLHAALAKAKPLLNPSLYRSLEASAADALQLASLAGVPVVTAGQQLVNGGTSVDRAIRRKADSMCRNLTELCLALCEGKHDPSSLPASPMHTAIPSGRLSRMSTARTEVPQGRPMSRLEARRSSILGDVDHKHVSPQREDSSDQESLAQQSTFERPRITRPSSRLTAARSRFDDFDDEDPTIRPPSQVGSEFSFRSKRTLDTRNATATTPHRSFSLREALTNRRASGQGLEEQRGLTRGASMSSEAGRPRWARESTPPVLEEDIGEQEGETPQSSRSSRLASLAHMKLGPRRVFTDAAARASSLSGRSRRVAVE